MSNVDLQHVVTGRVRLSFVHLFEAYAHQPGNEPKFSATILLPKSDIATRQKIDAAINAAIQDGVSSKWNGARPPLLAIPIHDGDGVRPSDGMPFGDECKGHWVFTASSKQAQEIIDLGMNKIMNQTEVYSGMYARVSVRFFAYNTNGKKGVGCGLGPVQKLEDGEPLGGRMSAAAAFGDAPGGYAPPAPVYQQQPTYAAPAQPGYAPTGPAAQPGYAPPAAPVYGQPVYTQPGQPQVQQPGQPQQPVQYDPITGKPLTGGVMGL